jgi:hypothetical protein
VNALNFCGYLYPEALISMKDFVLSIKAKNRNVVKYLEEKMNNLVHNEDSGGDPLNLDS